MPTTIATTITRGAEPIPVDLSIDLAGFQGKTFLEFMQEVKPKFDALNATKFAAPAAATVSDALDRHFHSQVKKKAMASLGARGLDGVVAALQNQPLTAATLGDTLFNSHIPTVLAPLISLAAGSIWCFSGRRGKLHLP